MNKPLSFHQPQRTHTQAGTERRVGFELEFAGADLPRLTARLAELYGGQSRRENPFVYKVENTPWGDFGLELDATLLKEQRYQETLAKLGIRLDTAFSDQLDRWALDLAKSFVPHEVVTPPIPLSDLHRIDDLEQMLRQRQAEGTGASFVYAFGMQFNPELPRLEAEEILAVLRAFFLLFPWLVQATQVDFSRKVAPYIRNFPKAYQRKVIDPNYCPDLEQLMDDYLSYNPTRNRPLDLTCLFAYLDEDRVMQAVAEPELVKPRPTYHYRLPDCRIDEPDWSIAAEWNRWVALERLAHDPDRLLELCRDFMEQPKDLEGWLSELRHWFTP